MFLKLSNIPLSQAISLDDQVLATTVSVEDGEEKVDEVEYPDEVVCQVCASTPCALKEWSDVLNPFFKKMLEEVDNS